MTNPTSAVATTSYNSLADRPPEPYVGLRPYRENERLLFFGREQDAARLQNTIFAGPLTVLYAPSGVGKTSLLVTMVVPEIRSQHGIVVFFDHWVEDNPCLGIKTAIIDEASAQGVAVQCASDAALSTLVDAVSKAADRPLVIVLDQFEQFLINHSSDPDPLRDELAALVRSEIDAHVVLSLRQEFLAALDTFRERILNLFRSTYHLLHLAPDDAARAITQPALLFDGSWEPALVTLLQSELRSEPETSDDPGTIHAGGVELPFLQIVCQRLWRYTAGSDSREVLLESYERLGRVSGIIREYVDEVVAALSREERADMAAVLDYLAPHSGSKMSYARQDLVERTGLPEPRVVAVLQLLSKHMVVRERNVGHTRRYELNHDAFIRVLRPWVDAELVAVRARALEERRQRLLKERLRRWAMGGVAATALLILGLIIGPAIHDWFNTRHALTTLEARLTSAPLVNADWARQSAEARQTLDGVTAYLTRDGSEQSLVALDEKLRRYDTLVTRYYAEALEASDQHTSVTNGSDRQLRGGKSGPTSFDRSRESGITTTSFGQIGETPRDGRPHRSVIPSRMPPPKPFRLVYANLGDLGVDSLSLIREWRTLATHLTHTLGVPIPLELGLSGYDTLPARTAFLIVDPLGTGHHETPDTTQTRRRLALPPRDALIIGELGLPQHIRTHYFRGDSETRPWPSLDSAQIGGPYHVVPLWTAPIWSVYGRDVVPRERAVALSIAARLLEDPSVLLNREFVRYLVDRERERAPRTMDELLSSPNGEERLDSVLTSLLRAKRPVSSLSHIVDVVNDHPGETPSQVAARLAHAPWQHVNGATVRATGARGASASLNATSRARLDSAYGAIVDLLPIDQPAVRVFAGAEAINSLVNAGKQDLQPALADSLLDLSTEIYRDFGLTLPDIHFEMDTAIAASDFRIEVLTQKRGDPGTAAMSPKSLDLLPQVTVALRSRLRASRAYFVSAESVDSLILDDRFPKRRAAWLRENFSVGDMKRMLRAVVMPTAAELSSLGDSVRPLPPAPAEHTIANPQWVLGSLVFWKIAGNPTNLDSAASYFREEQKARLAAADADPDSAVMTIPLYRAAYDLEMDSDGLGASMFRRMADSGPAAIRESFLRTYARLGAWRQLVGLVDRCKLPDLRQMTGPPSLSADLLPELEARLGRPTASKLAAGYHTQLELCLMGSYTAAKRYARAAREFDRVATDSIRSDSSWTADGQFRLSLLALMSPDFDADTLSNRGGRAIEMLLRAVQRLPDADASAQSLEALCSNTHPSPTWCRSMLDSVVRIRRDSPFLPLYFGNARADADRPQEARRALMLLDTARARLAHSPASGNEAYDAWVRYGHAKALLLLAQDGERNQLAAAATELRALLASSSGANISGSPAVSSVYGSLGDVQTLEGDFEGARETLERAAVLPDSGDPWITRHFLYLATNRTDSALHLTDSLLRRKPKDASALFSAATTQLLLDRPEAEKTARQFLENTRHEYRDYVRLMLYWYLSGRGKARDAHDFLEDRWAEIDTLSWPQRLLHRDRSVWTEMLVGYYLGKVPRDRVLAPLANQQRLDRSELGPLGHSIDAIRCEAFLYDALLQSVTGPPGDRAQRERASLDKVIHTKYYLYYEYHYARILRDRLAPSSQPRADGR